MCKTVNEGLPLLANPDPFLHALLCTCSLYFANHTYMKREQNFEKLINGTIYARLATVVKVILFGTSGMCVNCWFDESSIVFLEMNSSSCTNVDYSNLFWRINKVVEKTGKMSKLCFMAE